MTSRFLLLPAVCLVLGGLVGCAQSNGSGRAPDVARDLMYGVLNDTQTALGGRWDVQDDPTPRGCNVRLWQDGIHYPALRVAPAPASVSSAISEVKALWARVGFSVAVNDIGAVTEVQARSPFNELLIFRVSTDGMTLQGESECRPVG